MKTIEEFFYLSQRHNYYCSESSFYNLGFDTSYETWGDFISDMGNSDLDMNLVFRWDVKKCDEVGYYMEIFIIHQRKGRFVPFFIKYIEDKDLHSILEFLKKRKSHLKNLWEGI